MRNIKFFWLNLEELKTAERMAAFAARLTQNGQNINSQTDLMDLWDRDYTPEFIQRLSKLPHPTLQKFTTINVAVRGASRRFLQQITRHQNEVKFMSTSLQYSDYSAGQDVVIPYEILDTDLEKVYLENAKLAHEAYKELAKEVGHDAAGYATPLGFRTCMIISATPYQWAHMIAQRACRRNTSEMRYIMLSIWAMFSVHSEFFRRDLIPCQIGACPESHMSCGKAIEKHELLNPILIPDRILKEDFPKLFNPKGVNV